MSDDEDYMSDKFLQLSEKCATPSLVYRHTDKRQFELEKRKAEHEAKMKEKNKSIHLIEREKREEGMSNAIASSNKGFALLMKMGYKPGQGIGKTESGMIEPIGIELKADRHGLGKTSAKKETKSKIVDTRLDNSHMQDFRERLAETKLEQMLKVDLYKSQKVCQQLDAKANKEEPLESWFWVNDLEKKEDENEEEEEEKEEEEEEEDITVNEKLDILTKYLREKYFYCIWCGVLFEDENDLRDNCPGCTRNVH
ncbi:G patch domain-containing protein 11 [Vespa velutina]|uniref:G patch domain-containing protein 11 n=1 Tax=Vespa velutina TaxID=202808 RepID=UPI001FB253B5|nr:G patch domain-containing protein 11 [Vespa velutina]